MVTDSGSIYFKDTNFDADSFFWRIGEDLPENNNSFVYITPDQSTRNTYSGGVYSPHLYTSSDEFNYTLTGEVVSTHNDTLILNFNTVGLLPNKNMINDVTLLTEIGSTVTPGVTSSGITSANTTYYSE